MPWALLLWTRLRGLLHAKSWRRRCVLWHVYASCYDALGSSLEQRPQTKSRATRATTCNDQSAKWCEVGTVAKWWLKSVVKRWLKWCGVSMSSHSLHSGHRSVYILIFWIHWPTLLLLRWRGRALEPSTETFRSLMGSALSAGDWPLALQMLSETWPPSNSFVLIILSIPKSLL